MRTISRTELIRMLEDDEIDQVIEVLDEPNFRKEYLPGAVNVPVHDDDFERHVEEIVPNKSAPVVVYCQDTDCQASPEAGRRMDALGYQNVFDYEGGKDDWKSAGLRLES